MGRLANSRDNHISQWVLPAASRLLIDHATNGARFVPLTKVAHIEMGQSPKGESYNESGDGILFIGGPADLGLVYPEPTRWTNAPTKLSEENDIIICVRATIGEPRWSDGVYCLGRGVAAIRPKSDQLNRQFLFRVVQSNEGRLRVLGTGTTFKTISKKHIASIKIPMIPLDEQKQIGHYLDWLEKHQGVRPNFVNSPDLPTKLNTIHERIQHIEALAARIDEARSLRQSALEEAEALFLSASSDAFAAYADDNWYKIEDVCDVRGGIQKGRHRIPNENPIRYLTVAHVQRNWIDFDDPRYFEVSDEELERWRLLAGDVLVVEGNGSEDQIGRSALFRGELEDCVHQNHIIRVRPDQDELLPEYLNLYLNSPLGTDIMKDISRTSSGLYHLSVGKIKAIDIPVPELREQQKIVDHLAQLQKRVQQLQKLQAQSEAELTALIPSVLHQAFNGNK